MLVVVLVVVLLAGVGGAVFVLRSRSASTPPADEPGPSVDELLVNVVPPDPKPVSKPRPTPPAAEKPEREPPPEPAEPTVAPAEAISAPAEPTVPTPVTPAAIEAPATGDDAPGDEEAPDDDEAVVARFRVPGQRATGKVDVSKPMAPAQPVRHLEPPVTVEKPEPEPVAEVEPEPVVEDAEPEVAVAASAVVEPADHAEPEPEPEPAAEAEAESAATSPEAVVVLEEDGEPVVILEPTEDQAKESVDSVLQALIERVAATNQEVADAAAELVDRAGLDAGEVAEVLAELVERADGDELERDQELTLFSDQVPSRPGRLGHFANLPDKQKRLVIIRVLCLLVARSDEQREARVEEVAAEDDSPTPSPLARAVWPPAPEPLDDPDLPARSRRRGRLARTR